MALSPDVAPGRVVNQPAEVSPMSSAGTLFDASLEISQKPTIESLLFSSPVDPARAQLTQEERIKLHYAQTLADGELTSLTPRYRASDHDAENPFADSLAADPLSDPDISRLASIIRAHGEEGAKKD